MTMIEFLRLPECSKLDVLYHHGVYIGKRRLGGLPVILLQLDGFYVEICYRVYRREVEGLRCFTDTDRLNPYLAQISVELLV